ncbi:DIP1984 family protein [uncultured Shewanella sp.]|uniref:DIP1984 family protein n=1 Tax=uncultured Shewanella sp. TaxID=173975 RepID=UPI002635D197|nr:DIP1984 family protein [uncultured Shewanella sp.]
MKLAEALNRRAEISQRLQELRERTTRNVLVQEGDKPSENPVELLKQQEALFLEFENLVTRINKTNNQILLSDGKPMVLALSQRETLKLKHSLYKSIASAGTPQISRYSNTEIKSVSMINVSEIQNFADNYAQQLRELDGKIQQANWSNDLI